MEKETADPQVAITTQTRFRTTQAPVKNRVSALEVKEATILEQVEADEQMKEYQSNDKKLTQARNEYTTLEHNITVGLDNMLQEELEEIQKLLEKLRKDEEMDQDETNAVKQQVVELAQQKELIKKSIYALNSKIESTEVDVGYDQPNH